MEPKVEVYYKKEKECRNEIAKYESYSGKNKKLDKEIKG